MDTTRQDQQAARLREARIARGFKTAKEAAKRHGFNYTTYSQHERGLVGISRAARDYARAFKVSEGWLLAGEADRNSVVIPIMGQLGAGSAVEPDFEQVPPEGFEQIHIPIAVPGDMIAFTISGTSMLPVYKDGDVVVVYRDQTKPIEHFFGKEAAVRTSDGRRFIKTIVGNKDGTVTLLSWNADPIANVKLDWIGEIVGTFPASTWRKLNR